MTRSTSTPKPLFTPKTPKSPSSFLGSLSLSPSEPAFNFSQRSAKTASNVSLPSISLLPPTPTFNGFKIDNQQNTSFVTATRNIDDIPPVPDINQSKVIQALAESDMSGKHSKRPGRPRIAVDTFASTLKSKSRYSQETSIKFSPYPSSPDYSISSSGFATVATISPPIPGLPTLSSPNEVYDSFKRPSSGNQFQMDAKEDGLSADLDNQEQSDISKCHRINQHQNQYRYLTITEARQIAHLLTSHLLPIRTYQKEMMSECIKISEMLNRAGVKWDRTRRVMGLHLRGIWEEGNKSVSGSIDGFDVSGSGHGSGSGFGFGSVGDIEFGEGSIVGRMELCIQGSFLTNAEEPHPLDPTCTNSRPIPIPTNTSVKSNISRPNILSPYTNGLTIVNPSITSLLSNLPGIPMGVQQVDPSSLTYTDEVMEVDPINRNGLLQTCHLNERKNLVTRYRKGFIGRKNVGLWINTRGHSTKFKPSIMSAISLISASELRWSKTPIRKAHLKMRKMTSRLSGVKSATGRGLKSAARIGFDGWEVR